MARPRSGSARFGATRDPGSRLARAGLALLLVGLVLVAGARRARAALDDPALGATPTARENRAFGTPASPPVSVPAPTPVPASGHAVPVFRPSDDATRAWSLFLDKQNEITFAVAAVGLVAGHQVDPALRDSFAQTHRLGDFERVGNDALGTGVPGVLLAGGFWIVGVSQSGAYEVHAAQAQLEALAVTAIVTFSFKAAVRRERPDGSDRNSFPSGHTSTVAASAMTLQEFYGWKAGAPMFALTALTAASRLSVDAHWFTDTVAGAGIGFLVGHAFARAHLDPREPTALAVVKSPWRPLWLPLVTPNRATLDLAWRF